MARAGRRAAHQLICPVYGHFRRPHGYAAARSRDAAGDHCHLRQGAGKGRDPLGRPYFQRPDDDSRRGLDPLSDHQLPQGGGKPGKHFRCGAAAGYSAGGGAAGLHAAHDRLAHCHYLLHLYGIRLLRPLSARYAASPGLFHHPHRLPPVCGHERHLRYADGYCRDGRYHVYPVRLLPGGHRRR